jgi:CDP-diacylglycerol--serine O-phosphatidyltransferase
LTVRKDRTQRRLDRRRRRKDGQQRRAVFLLPNLITTAALMFGFWAIVQSIEGNWDRAAWGIILAGVCDGLDGRVARATRSTSRFGIEYDSLSDVVSFGIAPAVLFYNFALVQLGQRGWVLAALFAVCAALRLARFNVQKHQEERVMFQGVPSTLAGVMVAILVWFAGWLGIEPPLERLAGLTMTAGFTTLALLMVSSIPYPSWKSLSFSGRAAFPTLVALVLGIVLLLLYGDPAFFALGLVYLTSGPVLWARSRLRRRATGDEVVAASSETPDDRG